MAEIELLILANHAEVQNGLLYLSGAGWDTITRTYQEGEQPQPLHIGIAISVMVPWSETNIPHHVELWIEDEDGRRVLEQVMGMEAGRPPGRTPGSDIHCPLAMTGIVGFPQAGGYRVCLRVGEAQRTYAFRVVDQVTSSHGAI
ncbi:DUF6941 family protein [Candidatus Poriferisocius sp.]|uniref:DUF6941 family protein n=1 Tax=Candidatus Poriferisocius sp. TaxID=3101276 RepID=UPI003B02D2A7